MHNAAASSPQQRRPRTPAGTLPPQIALDVARIAATTRWLADTLDCCTHVTAPALVAHVLPALSARLSDRLTDVVVSTLAQYANEHLRRHRDDTGTPSTGIPLWQWMTAESLEVGLRRTYAATTAGASLEATVADVVSEGLDGELITWEVITRESNRHEGLILKECNRLARSLPDCAADDLKGYGWAGLRVALRNFDPSLGYAFSTYACPRINGAIRDGVRAESPIPKRLTTFVRKVSKAEEALTQQLGRSPSFAEIAAFVDTSIEAMTLLPRLGPTASLEELSHPWGVKASEPRCLIDRSAPEDEVLTSLRNEALHRAVDALPHEQAEAVRLLCLQEIPVGQAAAMVGVEPRQLRTRKQRAMRQLAEAMTPWMGEDVPA